MKILLIHNFYRSNNIGGEDIVFRQEAAAIKAKLGQDQVFTYAISNDQLNPARLFFSIWFSWIHFFRVYALVRKQRIQIVHAHNFFPILTPSIFLAAKLAGAKTVNTLHNYRFWCISGLLYRDQVGICELCVKRALPMSGIRHRCYRNSALQSLLAQLASSFYRALSFTAWIDVFFVLSEFQKSKAIEFGISKGKIKIKPNAVFIPSSVPHEKRDYIYVGRLEEAKGVDLLLQAWATLDSSFRLTLIGGQGSRLQELKSIYSQSNISFLGNLPHEQVLEKISASKFLLQTSILYETFGLTVIEAMSVGTPVIAFDLGTRAEMIRDGETGFLCQPATLRETIVKADQEKEYSLMSRRARDSALKFDRDRVLEQQISLYQTML